MLTGPPPQQVHAAAASYLNLRVEDTTMAVRSDDEPQLELAFYLRPGRLFKRWLKLAESAAAVQLAPLKASGLHLPVLPFSWAFFGFTRSIAAATRAPGA